MMMTVDEGRTCDASIYLSIYKQSNTKLWMDTTEMAGEESKSVPEGRPSTTPTPPENSCGKTENCRKS